MLPIPPIAAANVFSRYGILREGRSRPLECNVARAHYTLSQVFEAVVDVPRHLDWTLQLQPVVRIEDGVEAVQLMCHRRGEDGLIRIIVYGLWEARVLFWRLDFYIPETLCYVVSYCHACAFHRWSLPGTMSSHACCVFALQKSIGRSGANTASGLNRTIFCETANRQRL